MVLRDINRPTRWLNIIITRVASELWSTCATQVRSRFLIAYNELGVWSISRSKSLITNLTSLATLWSIGYRSRISNLKISIRDRWISRHTRHVKSINFRTLTRVRRYKISLGRVDYRITKQEIKDCRDINWITRWRWPAKLYRVTQTERTGSHHTSQKGYWVSNRHLAK